VRATGRTFTNDFALHITVTDGLITAYHMYEDSHAISAAFPPVPAAADPGAAPGGSAQGI
jgi:ketosteroid isomerase-like protein